MLVTCWPSIYPTAYVAKTEKQDSGCMFSHNRMCWDTFDVNVCVCLCVCFTCTPAVCAWARHSMQPSPLSSHPSDDKECPPPGMRLRAASLCWRRRWRPLCSLWPPAVLLNVAWWEKEQHSLTTPPMEIEFATLCDCRKSYVVYITEKCLPVCFNYTSACVVVSRKLPHWPTKISPYGEEKGFDSF